MGYQVIKQPDGKLAVFSTYTDTLVGWGCEASELIEWFVTMAANQERERATQVIEHVLNDEPRRAYAQFGKTWDEALERDREHGGDYSKECAT